MIYPAITDSTSLSVQGGMIQQAATTEIYESSAFGGPPPEFFTEGLLCEQAEISTAAHPTLEEFDWANPKVSREFAKLEQKVLAKKADPNEEQRYAVMRQNRNITIFADRYVNDYAEVQRLKRLSQKLLEVQQYLRPIRIG